MAPEYSPVLSLTTHTCRCTQVTPLTVLETYKYLFSPCQLIIIFIHIIACRLFCLFRNIIDSANTWPCIFIPLYSHYIVCAITCTHTHIPGEQLTLASKPPRGFLTFIGCQRQTASTETTALIKIGTPSCLPVTLRFVMIQCLHSRHLLILFFFFCVCFLLLSFVYLIYLLIKFQQFREIW